jgi:hypothetical protein
MAEEAEPSIGVGPALCVTSTTSLRKTGHRCLQSSGMLVELSTGIDGRRPLSAGQGDLEVPSGGDRRRDEVAHLGGPALPPTWDRTLADFVRRSASDAWGFRPCSAG